MAPSSSASTVTSVPKSVDDKTIRVNAKAEKSTSADAHGELKRDPIEKKYKDFFWTYTEEPHRTRRLAIIKAHPEVRNQLSIFQGYYLGPVKSS